MQIIQLTEERFRDILSRASQLGAHLAMKNAGLPVREYYTRTEMQQRHGRGHINSLIKAGKLTAHKLPEHDKETNKRVVYSETEYLSQII